MPVGGGPVLGGAFGAARRGVCGSECHHRTHPPELIKGLSKEDLILLPTRNIRVLLLVVAASGEGAPPPRAEMLLFR